MNAPIKTHWAMQYLGKPWQSGAQGPDAYDCWALVRAVQRDVFGRDLPLIVVNANNTKEIQDMFCANVEFAHWQQVKSPKQGDCVITKSSPLKPEHIGIWVDIDGGRILQAVYGSGVVLVSLAATKRIIGQHLEYWRYAAC